MKTTAVRLLSLTFTLALALTSACVQEAPDDTENDEESGEAASAFAQEPPSPQSPSSAAYTCTLGVDCLGPYVTMISNANGQMVAKVGMTVPGYNSFRRLDVFATVASPTGWALHVADSPTCDGWGGDGTTADHDAEGYLYNAIGAPATTFEYFSAYDMNRVPVAPGTFLQQQNARVGGATLAHIAAVHAPGSAAGTMSFDSGAGTATTTVTSLYGLKVDYTACASATSSDRSMGCDWEDRSFVDRAYWYVGVNRTVADAYRYGTGVTKACVVLSTDVNTVPPSCLTGTLAD